jgi:hypothetical protein
MKLLALAVSVFWATNLLSGSPLRPTATTSMAAIFTVHGTSGPTVPNARPTQTVTVCIPCCIVEGAPCAEVCVSVELAFGRTRNQMAEDMAEAIRAGILASTECNTLDASEVKALGNTVLVPGVSGFYTNPCPPETPCNSPAGATPNQSDPFVSKSYQGM